MVYTLGMTNKVCLGGRGVKFSPSRKQRKISKQHENKEKQHDTKHKENTVIRKQQRKCITSVNIKKVRLFIGNRQ